MQGKNNGERKNRVKKTEDSSCSLLSHFWSTFRSPFSTCYIPFQSSGSQESNASNGVRIGAEMRKIWPSQDNCIQLKDKFASCEFGTPTCEIKAYLAKWKWNTATQSQRSPTCESDFATCELGAQLESIGTPIVHESQTLRKKIQDP
ncbi:hypothetical protein AAG906_019395 [Vitis piasezkii]